MTLSRSVNKQINAFATLFSVIIMMLISSVVVAGILMSSNVGIQDNSLYRSAVEARALADSCANVAVNKLKLDNTYTGNETITIGTAQCQVLTITGTGNSNRVLRTSATVKTVTRKIEVSITTIDPTVISYWRDTAF